MTLVMISLAQQKLYFRSCRSQHSPGYVWPPVSLKCCSTLLCSYRATMSRAGSPVSFRCSGLFSWLDIKVFSVAERWNCSFSLDRKVSPLARTASCSGSDQGKRTPCKYKNVKKRYTPQSFKYWLQGWDPSATPPRESNRTWGTASSHSL